MGLTRLVATALAPLLAACSLVTDSFVTNDFSGDPYPIEVATANGAILVGLRTSADDVDRVAVLDVLSPITLIDPGLGASPSVSNATLTILGEDGAGMLALPRAKLPDKRVVSLHPCADATCLVGPAALPAAYDAIIGADALAGDALRLKLADDQVFVLADVAGEDRDRTFACDAVFPSPYRGGGTLVIAGAEIGFGGRRVTLQACLGNDSDPELDIPQQQRGADALLVLSTGIGISILGESAYERYRQVRPLAPAVADLPTDSAFIASGIVEGRRAVIDRMALVAASSGDPRAPCRQTYAHRLLLEADCNASDDCPCNDGDAFCAIPSHVELTPAAGIAVLVVPDTNSTLQALRTELRPDQPEVDGILGVDALEAAEVDIDYPHNRVLARCRNPDCVAHPALGERGDRDIVENCIEGG